MFKQITVLPAFFLLSAAQHAGVTVVPRYRGALPSAEARMVSGMHYDPFDTPLAWMPNGDLFITHDERYSYADVSSATCAGSGLYAVRSAGGSARTLSVGQPACGAALGSDGAAVDPTGSWIVYSARVLPNNSRLLRLQLSTARIETLPTGCRIYHDQPAIGPTGRLIAARGICRDREENYGVYITHADGSGLYRASGVDSASEEAPAWSPDGKRIAFERTQGAATDRVEEIAVMDVTGRDRRVLTRGIAPSWSPNGQWIAFVASERRRVDARTLRVIHPDGTGERVLFRTSERGSYSRGWGPMPEGLPSAPLVWSPDSRWIAFTRAFDRGSSIWCVELSSGQVAQITAPATP